MLLEANLNQILAIFCQINCQNLLANCVYYVVARKKSVIWNDIVAMPSDHVSGKSTSYCIETIWEKVTLQLVHFIGVKTH